jgi:hypothetical protein
MAAATACLQRHNEILHDFNQEFAKTKGNLRQASR